MIGLVGVHWKVGKRERKRMGRIELVDGVFEFYYVGNEFGIS